MNAISQAVPKSAGLFSRTGSNAVPLEGVKVHAEIVGHASRVAMTQRFRNMEDVPIEAVYVFPVPQAAAVCGLTVRAGDRVIDGEIEERDKAFDLYDEAMQDGHGAVLLDVERPNVLTMSVGNILPGQEVQVTLKWVAELPMEGDALRFVLPTTVAPRYAPEEDARGVSPTEAERLSPPVEDEVPYGLALDIDVALPGPVRSLESPSHPVRFEIDGRRAHAALSHERAVMDRDFVLLVTPAERGRPQVLVERNEDGLVTAAVSFVPAIESGRSNSEVIFLVDRSGSMAGSSIEQVRAALHLCLRSLHPGDRFNIVGFGSSFQPLFAASAEYEDDTLAKAGEHIDQMDADMGGTEILPALRAVLEGELRAGLQRQVVLLTDGEVSNEAAVIELAGAHRAHARIFTFGIGYGSSEHLVRSVARVSSGESEFIHPGERIEPKVLRQFARLGVPAVREVKVEWDGAEIELQAPHRPPAVFNGETAVVYGRFRPSGETTVTLSGVSEGKEVCWSVPVTVPAGGSTADLLATLAARAAIRDLEEGTGRRHHSLSRGSAQRGRSAENVRKEIVAIAKAYRLASSQTSFIAIERRENAGDQPAAGLRRVPVNLTKGWGGSERVLASPASRQPWLFGALAFGDISALQVGSVVRQGTFPRAGEPRVMPGPDAGFVASSRPSTEVPGPIVEQRPHVTLARLQHADGSWTLDGKLARALGVRLAGLRALARSMGAGADGGSVVATVAALCFLLERAGDVREEWRLLAEKAEGWLAAAAASLPAGARAEIERQLLAWL